MKSFSWNVVLAFLWAAVLENVSLVNLAVGFVLGFLLLALTRPVPGGSPYALRLVRLGRLVAMVTWDILVANLRIAHEVLTPRLYSRPAIYAYPMEAETDAEVTLFALLVAFTPGTLGLEVSEDERVLYVHVMFATSREDFTRQTRDRLELPLLEALR